MPTENKWQQAQREASDKAHASEVANLRLQLDHARQRISEMTKSTKAKIPVPQQVRHRQEGDTIRVIIPDTHGIKIDQKACSAMLADIKTLAPSEIILLGDHVDCGGHLAEHHVMGYVAETPYSYEDDISAANAFLTALQQAAPAAKYDYLEGNHERRVETWCVTQTLRHTKDADGLRMLYAPEFRLHLKDRNIAYYRQSEYYDNLTVPGVIKRGKCYFFHGFNTSKAATRATLEKIAGNCVFGHTHRAQSDVQRKVNAGIIGSWNPGCLCQLQPLWEHTNPSEWTHGYAVQLVAKNGDFLHLNIPVIEGRSLFSALLNL